MSLGLAVTDGLQDLPGVATLLGRLGRLLVLLFFSWLLRLVFLGAVVLLPLGLPRVEQGDRLGERSRGGVRMSA